MSKKNEVLLPQKKEEKKRGTCVTGFLKLLFQYLFYTHFVPVLTVLWFFFSLEVVLFTVTNKRRKESVLRFRSQNYWNAVMNARSSFDRSEKAWYRSWFISFQDLKLSMWSHVIFVHIVQPYSLVNPEWCRIVIFPFAIPVPCAFGSAGRENDGGKWSTFLYWNLIKSK